MAILGYYLDTIKALRTLKYAEAVVKSLEHIPGLEFTAESKGVTMTWVLEDKADRTLDILAKNDLPAFVAYVYVSIVDLALVERVTGKAELDGNDVAIGLAEVFTISDPSRPDNPLVFASEGKSYAVPKVLMVSSQHFSGNVCFTTPAICDRLLSHFL